MQLYYTALALLLLTLIFGLVDTRKLPSWPSHLGRDAGHQLDRQIKNLLVASELLGIDVIRFARTLTPSGK